jgi:catechol-2,3-dioxygenase
MSKIVGYVLRAHNRHETAHFYTLLGITAIEHAHGGPIHFELRETSLEAVTEIYSASAKYPHDALMVSCDNLARTLVRLEANGIVVMSWIDENSVYVKDPDGRDVLLLQA